MTRTTYYIVSDANYFPGAAAFVNSLRLTGNAGEVVVLDAGLTRAQRDRLAPHATVVDVGNDVRRNPLLFKAFPAQLAPEGLVVVTDSDVIVTGSLEPFLERARAGRICLFRDGTPDRWFGEWQEIFDLRSPLRRETYVASGFVAFVAEEWPALLPRWEEAARRIPSSATRGGGAAITTPCWDGDQDALNALLMSEYPPDAVEFLPPVVAPMQYEPRRRVRVEDANLLRCRHEGELTLLIHAGGNPKPWQRSGWGMRMHEDAYGILLPRVLLGDDVPIRFTPNEVPIWLRSGRGARATRTALDGARAVARQVRRRVAPRQELK
jgi:hypothetical protein